MQCVWDPDKKKWTIVDGDDDDESNDVPQPPPPRDSEFPTVTQDLLTAAKPSGTNVFKLNGPGKGKIYFNNSLV